MKTARLRRRRIKRIALIITALLGTAAIAFGAATLIMWLQPLYKAYALNIRTASYTFHIDDASDIDYYFTEVTDRPYLLKLQKKKLEEITFSSSDDHIVRVDETGHFTAVGKGSADVTVTVPDLSASIHVDSFVRGQDLSFEAEHWSLNVGETLDLKTIVSPEDAVLFDTIVYSVSDEEVIQIDQSGHLTALNPGISYVFAEADGLRAETAVRVFQPMTGIAISNWDTKETLHIERGNSFTFEISFFPENTTDLRDVTYTLSDPEGGTVDENGLFTALGRGPLTLTAECNGFTDSVELEMHASLTGIALNHTELTILYQTQDQLTYEVFPADTTDALSCIISSENPNVVTVDENGLVTAVGPGSANVIVNINGFEARCLYSVHVPVTAVNISAGSLTLNPGDVTSLSASVYPDFTTEDHSITWTSENTGIISIDGNGTVTAVNPGTTRVYAIHGAISNSCLITVRTPRSIIADRIIAFGMQFLGTPYVFGGNSLRGGIDCSSFTMQCFATQGIYLPRTSGAQAACGGSVPLDAAQWLPGDLIFYAPGGYISHVAIYIGNGQILQAAQSMGCVCTAPFNYNGNVPVLVKRCF